MRGSLLASWCVLLSACASERVEHPDPAAEYERMRAERALSAADGAVARLGREVILERDLVIERASLRGQARSEREALAALTDRALAAQAEVAIDPGALALARKRGLASAWVERTLAERYVTPSEEAIERRAAAIAAEERVPARARVSHVLLKDDDALAAGGQGAAALAARALKAELGARSERAELERLREIGDSAYEGVPIQVELGLEILPPGEPPGKRVWPRVGEAFKRAVSELDGPGAVSEPVATSYGWHVIVLEERLKAEPLDPQRARSMATAQLEEQEKTRVLVEAAARLATERGFELRPGALERAEDAIRIGARGERSQSGGV